MKQIKGYDVPTTGTPTQVPDGPVRALIANAFGFTATAYIEVELGDDGQPSTQTMILVQVLPPEQGVVDDWTWLGASTDGKRHLFKVADADAAS